MHVLKIKSQQLYNFNRLTSITLMEYEMNQFVFCKTWFEFEIVTSYWQLLRPKNHLFFPFNSPSDNLFFF